MKKSERMEALLRQSVPRISQAAAAAAPDVWPELDRRLRERRQPAPAAVRFTWFDWALAAGLAALFFAFPRAIPVILFHL